MTDPSDNVAHFQLRVLQDAYQHGLAAHWRRRAAHFEWAAPRADDYLGRATTQDRLEQALRCKATANACHARAALATTGRLEQDRRDFTDALVDVAQIGAA